MGAPTWPKTKYRKTCWTATGRRCSISKILSNQVLKLGKFVGIRRKGIGSHHVVLGTLLRRKHQGLTPDHSDIFSHQNMSHANAHTPGKRVACFQTSWGRITSTLKGGGEREQVLATRAGVCASRLTAVLLFSGALLAPGASQWSAGLSEVASAAVASEAWAGGLRGAVRPSRPPVLWIPHGPPALPPASSA